MNFLDQPRDVIINHELIDLPIADLLNACKTNPLFDQLCKDPDLWLARIKRDYPEVNWHVIKNPREFYLRQVLFGGQIYIHNNLNNNGDMRQVMTNTVPYDQLFSKGKYIAETLQPAGNAYLIVYSRPSDDVTTFSITPIAFQDKNHIEFIPGPARKITLVDILYWPPQRPYGIRFSTLEEPMENLKKYRALEQTGVHNANYMERVYPIDEILEDNVRKLVSFVVPVILDRHRLFNTPFYQQTLQFILDQQRLTAENPIIPVLRESENLKDINSRKQDLVNRILRTLTLGTFTDGTDKRNDRMFLGFSSYTNFSDFQRNYVNGLSDQQLQAVEFLVNQIAPISRMLPGDDEELYGESEEPMRGIVFNSQGLIVFISESD